MQTFQAPAADLAHPYLVKRAADLCKARPAVFAALVRYTDQLEREGVDRHEALRRALDTLGR